MRKTAVFVLALALSTPAWAFNTDQLLATIAMPLAVDAVSRVTGVPQSQLADLVTTLNQANVPPTQFVEVIRYVPVALNQPAFVQYVQTQASQGVTGNALVNAIVEQLRSKYNVTPVLALNGDPTTVVIADNYIPVVGAPSSDPLALIALPLAVAAVSDVTGVSRNELANLIATLNNANVPPTQMVEVLRYVPVALTPDSGPQFVQFVQQQTAQGVTGPALVPVVVQQLRTYYPAPTQIVISEPARVTRLIPAPQTVIVDQNFVPPAVVTRMREHPQGGPPGQLKKQLEVQTGAEVVQGAQRQDHQEHGKRDEVRPPAPMISSAPVPVAAPPPQRRDQGDQQKDNGNHGEHGKDGGGKGKGHGKD